MSSKILAISFPGTPELIIIAVIALLIFGRRLPDVARSVGRSIVEFKKGLKDVKTDVNELPSIPPPPAANTETARDQPTATSEDARKEPTRLDEPTPPKT